MDPEKNAAVIQDIGRSVRDSGTLFNVKPRAQLEDQKSFFSFEDILHPKSKNLFEQLLGNEAGYEKRPAPRQLNPESQSAPEEKRSPETEGK